MVCSSRGVVLHIFCVSGFRGRIGKVIDFPDIGMKGIDFYSFGVGNGTDFQDFDVRNVTHFKDFGLRNGTDFQDFGVWNVTHFKDFSLRNGTDFQDFDVWTSFYVSEAWFLPDRCSR